MPRRAIRSALALTLVWAALAACQPLYLPPVPESPTQPRHSRLDSSSALALVSGRPVLTVVLAELVGPQGGGWLYVQWFGPANVEMASDASWVTGADVGTTIEFPLPPDVELTGGEWRAAVSYAGFLLRQFRLEVPAVE
ncbi:MAG TPA: hypothetical protein VF164_11285 [Trueperaceae bacterium]